MPEVGGKKFPYTRKGKAEARVALIKKFRRMPNARAVERANPNASFKRGLGESLKSGKYQPIRPRGSVDPNAPSPDPNAPQADPNQAGSRFVPLPIKSGGQRGTFASRQARFARRKAKGLPVGYRSAAKRRGVAKNRAMRARARQGDPNAVRDPNA